MPTDHLKIYSEDYFAGGSEGFGYTDYDHDKQAMVPTFQDYLDRIERAGGKNGVMLDIGAATGFFLGLAQQRGWKVQGVEASTHAATVARSKGINVQAGTLENVHFDPSTFDVITMWDVIEHVTDPHSVIAQVATILKPGGLLGINTPDSGSLLAKTLGTKWHLVVPPEHLNLFNRKSLALLLQQHGFEILQLTTIGKKFTAQYVVQTLNHWQALPIWDFAVRHLRGSRLGELSVSINLYDNVFVLARRVS